MPQSLKSLRNREPFTMNKDTVNIAVANFLKSCGFTDVHYLSGDEQGVDVSAKLSEIEFLVVSEGFLNNNPDADTIFTTDRMLGHLSKQVLQLMYYNQFDSDTLLFMANPAIPRLIKQVDSIMTSLNVLGITRLWVSKDLSVRVDVPPDLIPEATKHNIMH